MLTVVDLPESTCLIAGRQYWRSQGFQIQVDEPDDDDLGMFVSARVPTAALTLRVDAYVQVRLLLLAVYDG